MLCDDDDEKLSSHHHTDRTDAKWQNGTMDIM